MAKSGGIFHTFGNLFRWAVWGLAAVLLAAIWLNWSRSDEDTAAAPPAAVTPADTTGASEMADPNPVEAEGAALPEGTGLTEARPVEGTGADVSGAVAERPVQTPEGVAAEESTVPEPAQAEQDGAAINQGTGLATTRPAEGEAVSTGVRDAVESAVGAVGGGATGVSEVAGAAASQTAANLPSLFKIDLPNDGGTLSLISVEPQGAGTLDIVSSKTTNGTATFSAMRVTCSPLAVGTVATGESVDALEDRNDTPEMVNVTLGDALAGLATAACGMAN